MTTFEHGDHRLCELQDDGTWKVRANPDNRGVVGLTCQRLEHLQEPPC